MTDRLMATADDVLQISVYCSIHHTGPRATVLQVVTQAVTQLNLFSTQCLLCSEEHAPEHRRWRVTVERLHDQDD